MIAAEDDNFFQHSGVSFSGILRAVWVNLRGGEIRQGGSTLTQQLVKNLYLTHERTLGRKAQELILAVLLEARYGKRQILEAYLNEIYLGGSGGVSLMGVGAASRAYFGKDAGQLDLAEAATLAGVDPRAGRLLAARPPREGQGAPRLGPGADAQAAAGRRRSASSRRSRGRSHVAPEPVVRRRAPYFADAMAARGADAASASRTWQTAATSSSPPSTGRASRRRRKPSTRGSKAVEKGYQKGHKGDGAAPGGPGLGRSRDRRHPGLRRRPELRRQPVRPRRPGPAAGGERLQADRLCRRLRDGEGHARRRSWRTRRSPSATAGLVWSPKNDDGSFHGW